jgi:hypothetical protein
LMDCRRCLTLPVAPGRRRYCNVCAVLAHEEAQERAMIRFNRKNPHYFRDVQRRRAEERGSWT